MCLICALCLGSGKSKGGRSNGRKTKSPGPGLSGGERPSSVSSVHSEGDCNRHTPLTNRVWEDRPSSTGTYSPGEKLIKCCQQCIWTSIFIILKLYFYYISII